MKIAILMTCHNRKEKTLKCLFSLFVVLPECVVFLVDDSSTDGTSEAVKEKFPQVNIIHGDGSLYWSRGMYTAWIYALQKEKYDFYLWLNDDLELYPLFFDELMKCYTVTGNNCIIVGNVEDSNNDIIYGGISLGRQNLPYLEAIEAVRMNGNIVLISQSVVEKIGIIDPILHHDLADADYERRARKAGIGIFTSTKAIALGYSNNFCRVRKWNSDIKGRLKQLYSPLGSPPHINFYFRKKHYSFLNACIYWLFLHIINLLSDNVVTMIWGEKYHDNCQL
jgi:GT2 family glycosyltransferase